RFQTGGDVLSSPAAVDINMNGKDELIVGSDDGTLYALQYETVQGAPFRQCDASGCQTVYIETSKFSLMWNYNSSGSIISSPAVADINGDGFMDVVFGSFDRNVYAIDHGGEKIFGYTTNGKISSSPAIADIDNDNRPDIIIGSHDMNLYVIDSNGSAGFRYKTNGSIRGSPAVADLDNDGFLEIVFGSEDGRVYTLGFRQTKMVETISTTSTTTPTSTTPTTITASNTSSSTTTTTLAITTSVQEEIYPIETTIPATGGGCNLGDELLKTMALFAVIGIVYILALKYDRRRQNG
ncbi:MAG: VCBS repeat-containing protein, partial [Candidatus Altiarchaeota archaeon]|nr:VCBS repeat-containing protein [Candidatus Altiarchaeota archaeon]